MSETKLPQSGIAEERLPRRDWVLIPIIAVVTVGLILLSTELIARQMFSGGSVGEERCHKFVDPISGLEMHSNCTYWEKAPESTPVEYRFNSEGYRSDVEFGPKSPGAFRIVLVGSSFGLGASTPREKTFAALLPAELSRLSGRAVELYNESIPGTPGLPQSVERRFSSVLAAEPDMVIWEVSRWDIKEDLTPLPAPTEPAQQNVPTRDTWQRVKLDIVTRDPGQAKDDLIPVMRDWLDSLKTFIKDSKTAYMFQHFLYESPSIYVKYSISGPDEFAGYLRSTPSTEWQARLQAFDKDVASIQARAATARVPLAVVLIPSRPQAAMVSMGQWPSGYDPYKLNDELRSIVLKQGATYIDIFPGFRAIPNAGRDYLPIDGHPNAEGHAVIARLLARALGETFNSTSGALPWPRQTSTGGR